MTTPGAPAAPRKQDTSVMRWPPAVPIVVGLVLISFFCVGCLMSMQTTEAWVLGWEAKMTPDATIMLQIPKFFDGTLSEDVAIGFIVAFTIQLILLITKIGLPFVHAYIARKHAGKPSTDAMEKSAKSRMAIWNFAQFSSLAMTAWADLL